MENIRPQSEIPKTLACYFYKLNPQRQKELLDFANFLASRDNPKEGISDELRSLAGSISDEDAEKITRAIEENCEQIDATNW